ncbi:hypothetical protein [Streptomyces coeruleofuscus]|uniref:hypothetical protein n=1 Tax=Streptomyces coeruleofuscus TaxID=66879 RepID=UPI0031F9C506
MASKTVEAVLFPGIDVQVGRVSDSSDVLIVEFGRSPTWPVTSADTCCWSGSGRPSRTHRAGAGFVRVRGHLCKV